MGNQLSTCCGLCPRDDDDDTTGDSSHGDGGGCGHYGESDGQGGYSDGVYGDDTAPLIRDGSGIARNAANSDRLGSSYAQNQSYQKEDLMADDNFAPSHDPEQQRLDDEQQKGFGQFVHGFAGEIVDNSGIEGVTAAVANVSADNSRGNNASGGTGTGAGGAGGPVVLEGAEAGEMASDYGKRLFRRAADMSKHLDPLGPKGAAGGRGMEDVSASQVEAHLTQRAESVLTDADQVLVTEVASRAGEVMSRAGHINVADSEVAVPYGETTTETTPAGKKKTSSSSSSDRK